MNTTYQKLNHYLDKSNALSIALSLLSWDNETLAPKNAIENTSKAIGILAGEAYETLINEDVKCLLEHLSKEEEQQSLTKLENQIIKELKKKYEIMEKVPLTVFQSYQELIAKAPSVWAKAKEENDFHSFVPILKEVMDYAFRIGEYTRKENEFAYDALLRDNEECFNMESLDEFFEEIKTTIVPLLKKVTKKKDMIQDDFLYLSYDVKMQKEFCKFVAEYIGFDFDCGVIAESAHPFTTNFHNKDVRITTHYYEHNLASAIFSVIHEGGHALYEMGVANELTMTLVGGGTSMGIHESQSRMYENMIGRSKEFWTPIYGRLQAIFPEQLSNISLDQFVKAINKVQPSLIRTEADELSYCLHIIIRYEIERDLFERKIQVEDLPEIWNKKYEEYLGVKPSNDTEGVLQDIHWSCGNIGYFPSYALGNAIAAQMYAKMKQVIPIEDILKEGKLSMIRDYLNDEVHKYGRTMNANEILVSMTGEPLNARYYTEYLTEKYTKLYEL